MLNMLTNQDYDGTPQQRTKRAHAPCCAMEERSIFLQGGVNMSSLTEHFYLGHLESTLARNCTSLGVSSRVSPQSILFSALSITLGRAPVWHLCSIPGMPSRSVVWLVDSLLWGDSIERSVLTLVKCTMWARIGGLPSLTSMLLSSSQEASSSHLYEHSVLVGMKATITTLTRSKGSKYSNKKSGRFCHLVEE